MNTSIMGRRVLVFGILSFGILSCDVRDKGTLAVPDQFATLAPRLVMANGSPVDTVDSVSVEVDFGGRSVVRGAPFSAGSVRIDSIPVGAKWSMTVQGLRKAVDGLHWPARWEGSDTGRASETVRLDTVKLVFGDTTAPVLSGSGLPAKDTATLPYGTARDTLRFHFPSTDSAYGASALSPDSTKSGISYYTLSFAVPKTVAIKIVDPAGNVALDTFRFSVAVAPADTSKTGTTALGITLNVVSKDSAAKSAVVQAVVAGDGIDSVVSTFGSYRKSLKSPWIDTLLNLKPGPNLVVDTVFYKGRKGVASVTIEFPTNSTDKVPPTLSRQSPFSKDKDLDTVDWSTTNLLLSWKISDSSGVRSAYLVHPISAQTPPGGRDSIWTSYQSLRPGLDTFVLVAVDNPGNADTDTVVVFRPAYKGSPVVVRQVGTKDALLPAGTTSFPVSWVATDSIGVAASRCSLTVNGSPVTARHSADPRLDTVTATVPVADTARVRFLAVDSSGNWAQDSVLVRVGQAPAANLTTTGALDTLTTSSVDLAWTVIPKRGGVASVVLYNGTVPQTRPSTATAGNQYTATVGLNAGGNVLRFVAKDSVGDSTDVVTKVFYRPDVSKPVVSWRNASRVDSVKFGTSGYAATWAVTSIRTPLTVKVDTTTLSLKSGSSDTFVFPAKLRTSVYGYDTTFHLVATAGDSTTKDSLLLHVLPSRTPPGIARTAPQGKSGDTVQKAWDTTSIQLSWTIKDTGKVTSASLAITNASGRTTKALAPPQGTTWNDNEALVGTSSTFVLTATDSMGNASSDTVHVVRKDTTCPKVAKAVGTKDTILPSSVASFTAKWTVNDKGLATVVVNDTAASLSGGQYGRSVSLPDKDSVWVKLVATDSSNNATRDSILVRRLRPPTMTPSTGATKPFYVTIASAGLGALEDSVSTGDGSWTAYAGPVKLASSARVFARSTLGGVVSDMAAASYALPPTISSSMTVVDTISPSLLYFGMATVQWRTDTTKPWNDLPRNSSIGFNKTTTFHARCYLDGFVSPEVSATYTIKHKMSLSDLRLNFPNNPDATGIPVTHVSEDSTTYWTDTLGMGVAKVSVSVSPSSQYVSASVVGQPADGWFPVSSGVNRVEIRAIDDGPDTLMDTLEIIVRPRPDPLVYAGATYPTTRIGNQIWMAANLNYGGSDGSLGACYGGDASNCTTYGGLYTWKEVMNGSTTSGAQGICPDGWHVPSNEDWVALSTAAGGNATGFLKASGFRSTSSDWGTVTSPGTDTTGFGALPGGEWNTNGANFIDGIGSNDPHGFWWTSTGELDASGYNAHVWAIGTAAGGNLWPSTDKNSLRCVKN